LIKHGQADEGTQLANEVREWMTAHADDISKKDRATFAGIEEQIAYAYSTATQPAGGDSSSTSSMTEQQRCRLARFAVWYYFNAFVNVGPAYETCIPFDKAVKANLRVRVNHGSPLEVADQILAGLDPQAPEYAMAAAQVLRMFALAWGKQYSEAVDYADEIVGPYINSPNKHMRYIGADILGHAYVYSMIYLHDEQRASKYLQMLGEQIADTAFPHLESLFRDVANDRLNRRR
jgi:hypothetical protein